MEGNHTVYASNTSTFWKFGTILYKETSLPTEIHLNSVFRYLTYVPPVQRGTSELEVCEIGIVGECSFIDEKEISLCLELTWI